MKKRKIQIIFVLLGFILGGKLHAQDIEQVIEARKADPLQISGAVGVQLGGSEAYGIANSQRPPFYWSTRASLNLKFFDLIDAPLSFSYSPQGRNFDHPFNRQLPFNQIGISPRYKGLTVHLGFRAMQISKYSLAGTSFNGVGVEWKPKDIPWEISALVGQFAKASTDTTVIDQPGVSLYNRSGFATKVKYKTKKGAYGFHLFKASDKEETAFFPINGLEETAPKDNLIAGVTFQQQLFKKINVQLELVHSAYSRNKLASQVTEEGEYAIYNPLNFLYQPKTSSIYSGAIDGAINWNNKIVALQLSYKRIGSDYLNIGSPYFNNDLEVVSVGFSKRLFKNKVSVQTNVGLQQNNLDDTQLDKTRRLALNGSLRYAPVKRWNMNLNYANFTTNTTQLRINELDSLAFYQVSENMSFGTTIRLGEKMKKQVGLTIANQQVRDTENRISGLQTASVTYGGQFEKLNLRPQIRLNYIRNEATTLGELTQGGGFSAGLSKTFMNKKISTRLNYNETWFYQSENRTGINRTLRVSSNLKIRTAHALTVSMAWLDRNQVSSGNSGEIQYNVGYNYSFNKGEIFKRKVE